MAPALLYPDAMRNLGLVVTLAVAMLSAGCIAAPALAPAALSAGGDLVKAGAVRLGGSTFRTFSLPLAEVRPAVKSTLEVLGFPAPSEEAGEERTVLHAEGVDRTVRIDLQPITPVMTQVRVSVRKSTLGQDPATASELIARIEQKLAPAEARQARRKVSERPSK
jgi:hypothetical protein